MSILILTGPSAAGKTTISTVYANSQEQVAYIDVDTLCWMQRRPHTGPWSLQQQEAGQPLRNRGVKHACMLAKSFVDDGFEVIISDVILPDTRSTYQEQLTGYDYRIVQLMPTWEEILRRKGIRENYITEDEIRWTYDTQQDLSTADHVIDNTTLEPDEVAELLETIMQRSVPAREEKQT